MALTFVTITGTFDDGSGTALNGTVTFTPSETVYAGGIPVVSTSAPVVAQVINGALKSPTGGVLQLLATDNTGLSFEGMTGFFFWSVSVGLTGQSWDFFLPSSPSSVDLYSLANTVAGGGGFTSPMTTLGDLIYEDATPKAARLAGSTSSTRKFLRQTGTGSVSAAPAWDTLQAADIPQLSQYNPIGLTGATTPTSYAGGTISGHPLTGTWAQGQWVVDETGKIYVCVTGGTPGTWRRVGADPWQFFLDDYCKGDGLVAADVATTATSNVIVSPSIAADPNAVGKHILINGGNGAAAGPVIGVINAVNTGNNQVTLSVTAGATASNCAVVWASDDVANVNTCVGDGKAYALANDYSFEVIGGAKIYGLAGLTQQSTPAVYNSQIPVPYPDLTGAGRKLTMRLAGPVRADHCQFWESTTPNLSGMCLVSFLTAPSSADPTYDLQSVIGGPSKPTGITGSFINTKVILENLSIWCGCYTNIQAFNFGWTGGAHVDGYSSHIFAPPVTGTGPLLTNMPADNGFKATIGCGGIFPVAGNNDDIFAGSVVAEGYELGFTVMDHFVCQRMAVIYSNAAISIPVGSGLSPNNHLITIQSLSAESYNGGIRCISGGGQAEIDIHLDAENGGSAYDVYDNGNALRGVLYWQDTALTRVPVVGAGAANLKIVNNQLGPGAWSGQPAVPSSTVAQQNTSWRDAAVSVKGGTVTVIAVDGATVATATGTTVIVPSGKNITLTYSVAPTWAWTLL